MISQSARLYCEEYDYLDGLKRSFANEFQDIVDYVLPDRSNVTRWTSPGERRGISRYDSTATESAEILAGNLAATLTPMGSVWMHIVARDPKLRQMRAVMDWCQEVSQLMLASMSTSNFYLAMDEVYLDLVGFATAAPYAEMLGGKLHYRCWPVREYCFTVGMDGKPRRIYRQFTYTPAQLQERFANHPGFKGYGPTVSNIIERGSMNDASTINKPVRVLHIIGPRDFYMPGKAGRSNMPIESCYINRDEQHLIAEGGYEEAPVSVTRWRLTADDAGWGRGPSQSAMPNIRSLNVVRKMMHRALAKDLDPPLLIDDKGVIGSVRTVPNGITYMRPNARMEYLTSGQRIDVAQFGLERLTQEVRAAYYADHLRLPPPQGTPMTATEIQLRWEMMERLLGPTLGRLVTELLNPVIERTFGLMLRAGQLPELPQALNEAPLEIEYIGPLAKAQSMPEVAAIERTYQSISGIAQLTGDPSGLRRLNNDAASKKIAELYGFPADALRDDEEVEQMAAAEEQQKAEMQSREDAMMAADMAAKVPVPTAA